MDRPLRIATRGSALALRQADIVARLIIDAYEDLDVEIVTVSTTGDRDLRSFGAIGRKGIFVAEVERAVVEGRADVAVHSAKDLTADLAPGCEIACVPRRAAVEDAVIGGSARGGLDRLGSLPAGARVGTSSLRRRALLAEARPDLDVVELRGNLDTRLRKVADGDVDAGIVATAGLERLGRADEGARLDPEWWVPAPGQGALAVEALASRSDVVDLVAPLSDRVARAELEAERAFSRTLEGGCSVPLGCLARVSGASMTITGWIGLTDGTRSMRDKISGGIAEAADLGAELGTAMLECGGRDLLDELTSYDAAPIDPP